MPPLLKHLLKVAHRPLLSTLCSCIPISSFVLPVTTTGSDSKQKSGQCGGDLPSERNRDQSLERAVFLPFLLRAVSTLHGPALAGAPAWSGQGCPMPDNGRFQALGRAEPFSEAGALHRCCSSLRSRYTLDSRKIYTEAEGLRTARRNNGYITEAYNVYITKYYNFSTSMEVPPPTNTTAKGVQVTA